MRHDLDEKIREEIPAALKARVAQAVDASLERNRARAAEEKPGIFDWLLRPAPAMGAAGALAAVAITVLVVRGKPSEAPPVASAPLAYDLDMIADAELLQDLDVLDQWEALKKNAKGEWKKKEG